MYSASIRKLDSTYDPIAALYTTQQIEGTGYVGGQKVSSKMIRQTARETLDRSAEPNFPLNDFMNFGFDFEARVRESNQELEFHSIGPKTTNTPTEQELEALFVKRGGHRSMNPLDRRHDRPIAIANARAAFNVNLQRAIAQQQQDEIEANLHGAEIAEAQARGVQDLLAGLPSSTRAVIQQQIRDRRDAASLEGGITDSVSELESELMPESFGPSPGFLERAQAFIEQNDRDGLAREMFYASEEGEGKSDNRAFEDFFEIEGASPIIDNRTVAESRGSPFDNRTFAEFFEGVPSSLYAPQSVITEGIEAGEAFGPTVFQRGRGFGQLRPDRRAQARQRQAERRALEEVRSLPDPELRNRVRDQLRQVPRSTRRRNFMEISDVRSEPRADLEAMSIVLQESGFGGGARA